MKYSRIDFDKGGKKMPKLTFEIPTDIKAIV